MFLATRLICFISREQTLLECRIYIFSALEQWSRNEFESGESPNFCRAPTLLWLYMLRFGERFRDGQYSLLFFYSRCPLCPAICKSGGTCPPRAPLESAPLSSNRIVQPHVKLTCTGWPKMYIPLQNVQWDF